MQLLSKLSQRHSYYLISSFTASACSINPWQWNKFTYHIRHRQRSYMLHRPCGKQLTIKSLSEFWNLQSICWFKYFVLLFGFCVWLNVKCSVRKKSTLLIKNSTFSEEASTCHGFVTFWAEIKKKRREWYIVFCYIHLFLAQIVSKPYAFDGLTCVLLTSDRFVYLCSKSTIRF